MAVGGPVGIVLSRRFASRRAKVAVRMAALGAAVVLAEGGALAAVRIGVGERFGVSLEGRPSRDAVASSQYRDEYKDLVSHPRFREVTAGKSPAEVRALAAILTTRGLQYLELPALQEWARIKLRMAERSPKLCAGMWKGRVDDPALGARTLTELGEPDARAWARLSARASLLALQDAPAPSADGEARVLAVRSIIATLPEGTRPAAIADVVKRDELSDERACELMRLMLGGSRALAPELQHAFLRALTQQ